MKQSIALAAAFTCGIAVLAIQRVGANVLELQPSQPIPSSCNVTPVYGSDTGPALPWVDAEPRGVSGITMTFARAAARGHYTPLSTRDEVILRAPSSSVSIRGKLEGSDARSLALVRTQLYQTINFPQPGCWDLQLEAGGRTGYLRLWIRPAP